MTFSFVYIGNEYHSYGYSSLKVAGALAANGARLVDLVAEVGASDGTDWAGPPWEVDGPAVVFTLPEWWPHVKASPMVGFTMFEGYGLPRERVRIVNETCDLCLVPSQWCADGFRESGVTVPIRVVPLGVDERDWPYMERERVTTEDRPYRFLWNGLPDVRKGWDLVYKAFWDAFKGSDEVELWLHYRKGLPMGQGFGDGNVRVYNGYHSQSILKRMLREVDCYVFPSRAEGWGLPPREAASTGLPVIATEYGGLAENIRDWAMPLRVCKTIETRFQGAEDEAFEMAEPCPADLADSMRWCFENPGAAREMGRKASEWLRLNGGWDVTVRGILDAVEEVG